jgi:cytochrome c556
MGFIGYAHGLYDAAAEILKAIDAKDVARMDAAGEKLDAACEACHRAFWYPNAPEPTQTYNGKRIGVN